MATNKIVLRETDEFMAGYVPVYNPLYALLLGNSQAYSEEVGQMNFRRLEAVGDLRMKHITPKDTEIRQIAVKDSSKIFKKYFLANQYIQSLLQSAEDIEGIVAQVLDENQKLMDDLVLLGEGTAANNVVNDGLYWNDQDNYRLENSATVLNAPDTQASFYETIMGTIEESRKLSGRKAIIVYGATALGKLNSLFPDQAISLKASLEEVLEDDESIVRMPADVTPSNVNGWMVVNLDRTKLHYTTLPKLDGQGVNEEKKHSWHNFLVGSTMVEVQAQDAVIRQPVTFEA